MSGTYAQTWVCGKHYPHDDEPEECPWCEITRLRASRDEYQAKFVEYQRLFENRNKDVGELVAEMNRVRELEKLLDSCLTSLAAVASFEYSLLMWSGWAKDARKRVAEIRAALEEKEDGKEET